MPLTDTYFPTLIIKPPIYQHQSHPISDLFCELNETLFIDYSANVAYRQSNKDENITLIAGVGNRIPGQSTY